MKMTSFQNERSDNNIYNHLVFTIMIETLVFVEIIRFK